MYEVLALLVCLGSLSNYNHRNCQMEHSLMVYPDSRFGHSLGNFPHSDHLTDSYSKKVGMLITRLPSAYYADFSFPFHPISEFR